MLGPAFTFGGEGIPHRPGWRVVDHISNKAVRPQKGLPGGARRRGPGLNFLFLSRIFYFDGTNADLIVWADVETEPEIAISKARGGSVDAQVNSAFQLDVTRQGDRVLMAVPVHRAQDGAPGPRATGAKASVHVVVNWFEELEAALPTDG